MSRRLAENPALDTKRCERCSTPFRRPTGTGRPSFAKYRYCSKACAQLTIAERRAKRSGIARPPAPQPIPPPLPEPSSGWRVYWADKPSRPADSYIDARDLAIESAARYVEIADLSTGQHLMRFEGRWIETRPAGSPLYLAGRP